MKRKKTILLVVLLAVCLLATVACKGGGTLDAPAITLNGNVVSWKAVKNATSYSVKVGSDAAVNVTGTSYTINKTAVGSYDVTVIAKSTDDKWQDSAASNKVTYVVSEPPIVEKTPLAAPVITLNENVVSWTAVPHAASYAVTVGSKAAVTVTATSYTITETEMGSYDVTVVAKANDDAHTDSAASNKVTYVVSEPPVVEKTALAAPVISLNGNTVGWTAVPNAVSYDVIVDDDAPVNVTTTSYALPQTEVGSYKVTVIAKAGESETYKDSVASNEVTYTVTQPVVVALTEIEVDPIGVPEKLYLDQGITALDLSQIVVTAYYDNGTEKTVALTDVVVPGYDLTTVGNKTITISYTENGVTETADIYVTVAERGINDIDEYKTLLLEYSDAGKYTIEGTAIRNMKGQNMLDNGQVTLPQGKTLLAVDDQFVVVTVAKFVNSKEIFLAIANDMDGYYVLTADIDFGGGWYNYGETRTSSSIIGAVPFNADATHPENHKDLDYENGVGTAQVGIPFNGTIDGQGYAIKNLKMHCSDQPQGNFNRGVSIIGYVSEQGTVCNITLRNIYVTAGKYASFLVGYNKGTINNICVEADCAMQTQYSGGTLVAAYNDGKVSNVVSYVSTYIGFNANVKDFIVANNKEIEEESGKNNVLHGQSSGYIADRTDLTETLGDGWRYYEGHGTVLVNDDYVFISTSERELAIGTRLYLNALFGNGDKVNFALYNPGPIDPDTGVVKYGWDGEKGSHYLYVNMEADPMITAGSKVTVVIYTTGWKTSQQIEITIVDPVVVNNELVNSSIEKIEGTDLEASAVQIKQTYSNGAEQTIAAVNLEGYDKNGAVGVAQTVKAFYGEGENDFVELTVTIIAKAATGIAIDPESSYKATYTAGEAEELDLTGLKIIVSYNNGTTENVNVTAAMLSEYDLSEAGVKNITITHLEKTCTLQITVNAAGVTVTGISVSGTPAKTTYKLGETVSLENLSGITVTATLSDGSSQEVVLTLPMLSYDFTTAGSKDITITYEEQTATVPVTVVDYATALTVTPSSTTLSYNKNTTLNLKENVTYSLTMESGASVTDVDVSKITVSNYKSGANEITYTYADDYATVTATQNYDIWYEITDADGAATEIWSLMQDNLNGYYRLTIGLDFNGAAITPLGHHGYATNGDGSTYDPDLVGKGAYVQNLTEATPFTGKFDGQGHQIRRFKVGEDKWSVNGFAASLFGYIGKGAVVENVVIRQAEYLAKRIGFIACVNEGTVSNVLIDSTCTAQQTFGNEDCNVIVINTATGVMDNVVSYLTTGKNSVAGAKKPIAPVTACMDNRATDGITDFYVVDLAEAYDASKWTGLDGWDIIENVGPAFGDYVIVIPEKSAPEGGVATFRIYHGCTFKLDYINIWGVSNPEAYPKTVSDTDGVYVGTVTLKEDMTEGNSYTLGLRIDGKYFTYSLAVTAKEGL